MRFALPHQHKDKGRTSWKQNPHSHPSLTHNNNTDNPPYIWLTKQQVKQGVLEGYIHSADWYTVCTSHKLIIGDIFIQTDKKSTKIFALADGQPTLATNIAKLEHRVHEPARTFNVVPAFSNQSPLSGGEFVEVGYVPV